MPLRTTALLVALVAAALLPAACGDGTAAALGVSTRRIDFGRILWGDVARRTVVLTNRSARDVTVTHTATSCACFQLRPFLRTLHPGETREIEVSFVSGAVRPGPIHGKRLQIVTDAPGAERIEVDLLGDIVPSVTFVPDYVDLGRLDEPYSRAEQVVKLRPGPDMTLQLLRWRVQPEGVFEASEEAAEDGVDFHVRLTELPPRRAPHFVGSLEVRVRVEGGGFEAREIEHVIRIQGLWPE